MDPPLQFAQRLPSVTESHGSSVPTPLDLNHAAEGSDTSEPIDLRIGFPEEYDLVAVRRDDDAAPDRSDVVYRTTRNKDANSIELLAFHRFPDGDIVSGVDHAIDP